MAAAQLVTPENPMPRHVFAQPNPLGEQQGARHCSARKHTAKTGVIRTPAVWIAGNNLG